MWLPIYPLTACCHHHLWCNGQVTKLTDLAPADTVCSVAWSQKGTYLSVGTNTGKVQLWDVSKMALVRRARQHAEDAFHAWMPTPLHGATCLHKLPQHCCLQHRLLLGREEFRSGMAGIFPMCRVKCSDFSSVL